MSSIVIVVMLSLGLFGQTHCYGQAAPDMAVLAEQCLAQDSKTSPIEFQLDGYCMLFTCIITQTAAGSSASVKTKGCGGVSSRYPCFITEVDLKQSYPTCCPHTQCPN